ncbi:hypothetical protein Tco_0531523 [Tanacetum coccineum]
MKAVQSSSHVSILRSLSSSSQVFSSPVVTFNNKLVCGFRNGDCGTGSQNDNTVGIPHGFVIHGIKVLKGNEKVTKVIDVENLGIDNSRMLRWIVSLFEWNSSVLSMKSSIQKKHVPEVIALNEPDIPHTEDAEGPPDLINTEGTHEQNVQEEQTITQSTKGPSRNNIKVLVYTIESLVPDVPQSQISNQASICSQHVPQNRWSKDQHIKLVNIICDPSKGMLTRSMASKLTAALASECLFANFLSKIEPKKASEALKHPG